MNHRPFGRLALAIVLVSVLFAPATVAGTVDPQPTPAAYYGELTAAEEPIPAGVTVTAEIDGEVRGELVTTEADRFGGAGAFEPKLQVDGESGDAGAVVRFYVDGVEAAETVQWQSSDVRSVDLSVADPWESADGGGGGGFAPGTGGGGVPGGDTPSDVNGSDENSTDDTPATVDVRPDPTEPGVTDVAVTGGRAGETVSMNLGTDEDAEFSMTGLTLVPAVDGDFTLRISTSPTLPDETPALADEGVIEYVTVDHSISDANLEEVTFSFTIGTDVVADRGVDPDAIALYRYHDDRWTELPTSHVDTVNGRHVFDSDSPGLSVFAVALRGATADSSHTDETSDAGDDSDSSDERVADTDDAAGSAFDRPVLLLVVVVVAIVVIVGFRYGRSARR